VKELKKKILADDRHVFQKALKLFPTGIALCERVDAEDKALKSMASLEAEFNELEDVVAKWPEWPTLQNTAADDKDCVRFRPAFSTTVKKVWAQLFASKAKQTPRFKSAHGVRVDVVTAKITKTVQGLIDGVVVKSSAVLSKALDAQMIGENVKYTDTKLKDMEHKLDAVRLQLPTSAQIDLAAMTDKDTSDKFNARRSVLVNLVDSMSAALRAWTDPNKDLLDRNLTTMTEVLQSTETLKMHLPESVFKDLTKFSKHVFAKLGKHLEVAATRECKPVFPIVALLIGKEGFSLAVEKEACKISTKETMYHLKNVFEQMGPQFSQHGITVNVLLQKDQPTVDISYVFLAILVVDVAKCISKLDAAIIDESTSHKMLETSSEAVACGKALQAAEVRALAFSKHVFCKDASAATSTVMSTLTVALAKKFAQLRARVVKLMQDACGKAIESSKEKGMVDFVRACDKEYPGGLEKADVWEMVCTPAAGQFYTAHRFFTDSLGLVQTFKTELRIDLEDVGASDGAVHSKKLLASLTAAQALYRPLKPDETRSALLMKCSTGMQAKHMLPHASVAAALQKMIST
jgi:hypothetical protein